MAKYLLSKIFSLKIFSKFFSQKILKKKLFYLQDAHVVVCGSNVKGRL